MLLQFKAYIEKKKLFTPDDTILLGLSGGIDSRVLFDLFLKSGYKIAVAHCNFGLRGGESNSDEEFVQNLAQEHNLPFHKIHFNTTEYAELQKISIQMAARELRYNWFENVRRNYKYSYIAIAHNSDDALETFFINLSRGTGIKGISGIKSKNNHIVRPLLFADRATIEQYCVSNDLEFREDSSNKTDKYIRNDIRHNLIPLLNNILPDFKKVMTDNFEKFTEAGKIYEIGISSIAKQLLTLPD
jgi:tRNA(Ile)-lysidine synthase